MFSRDTFRLAALAWMASALVSHNITLSPAQAATWAMPEPIWPARVDIFDEHPVVAQEWHMRGSGVSQEHQKLSAESISTCAKDPQ